MYSMNANAVSTIPCFILSKLTGHLEQRLKFVAQETKVAYCKFQYWIMEYQYRFDINITLISLGYYVLHNAPISTLLMIKNVLLRHQIY